MKLLLETFFLPLLESSVVSKALPSCAEMGRGIEHVSSNRHRSSRGQKEAKKEGARKSFFPFLFLIRIHPSIDRGVD